MTRALMVAIGVGCLLVPARSYAQKPKDPYKSLEFGRQDSLEAELNRLKKDVGQFGDWRRLETYVKWMCAGSAFSSAPECAGTKPPAPWAPPSMPLMPSVDAGLPVGVTWSLQRTISERRPLTLSAIQLDWQKQVAAQQAQTRRDTQAVLDRLKGVDSAELQLKGISPSVWQLKGASGADSKTPAGSTKPTGVLPPEEPVGFGDEMLRPFNEQRRLATQIHLRLPQDLLAELRTAAVDYRATASKGFLILQVEKDLLGLRDKAIAELERRMLTSTDPAVERELLEAFRDRERFMRAVLPALERQP